MAFRVGLTSLTILATLLVGAAGVTLVADGRLVIGLIMFVTASIVGVTAGATWKWSGQAEPVRGIHY
jgi:hypothetical protein